MKSNLKKYYDKRYKRDIVKNNILNDNPFAKVHKFISEYDYKFIADNFYNNLFNLTIEESNKNDYNYDYEYNKIYSSDKRLDIYAVLTLASTDRFHNKKGIIKDNIGYGLNNGITDYYNQIITKNKSLFPFENFVANTLDKIDKENLAKAYFDPYNNTLENIIPQDSYNDFNKLLDEYHNMYLKLMYLYKEKFYEGRYYYNLVYGNTLKKKNTRLTNIENNIELLEKQSYENVYLIILHLINYTTYNHNLSNKEKQEILLFIKNKFNKLTLEDNLSYLRGLNSLKALNNIEKPDKKIKELRK